jgi:hypothetical protein
VTVFARGYVDDRLSAERLRFPRFALRKDGEMLAFAHIPTGNNNKEGFIIFDFEGGRAGQGASPSRSNPAIRTSMRPRAPSRVKRRVRYFLLKGGGQKIFRSRGAKGESAALLTGPPQRRFSRSQGRDGGMGFRVEHRDAG